MLETVGDLRKKEKKNPALKTSAFQHLLLLVGIHLFKVTSDRLLNFVCVFHAIEFPLTL